MASDTQRRVKFCLVAAILDFLVLSFPKLDGVAFYSLVSLGVLLNLTVMWIVLKGVKPLRDESEHFEAIAHAKRWIALLGGLMTIVVVAISFTGTIEKQAIPFLALGYVFLLLLPMKIFDLAVKKRMSEIGSDS